MFNFQFQTGSRACNFGLGNFVFEGDKKVKFVLSGENNTNATSLLRDVPLTQEWFDLLDDTFIMSSESAFDPYIVKFTSSKNSENFFTLKIYQRNEEEGGGDVN
jgi:hypothetical protein